MLAVSESNSFIRVKVAGVGVMVGVFVEVLVAPPTVGVWVGMAVLVGVLVAAGVLVTVFATQVLTYLRLAKLEVGLLINFNRPTLKDGVKRFVLSQPRAETAVREISTGS